MDRMKGTTHPNNLVHKKQKHLEDSETGRGPAAVETIVTGRDRESSDASASRRRPSARRTLQASTRDIVASQSELPDDKSGKVRGTRATSSGSRGDKSRHGTKGGQALDLAAQKAWTLDADEHTEFVELPGRSCVAPRAARRDGSASSDAGTDTGDRQATPQDGKIVAADAVAQPLPASSRRSLPEGHYAGKEPFSLHDLPSEAPLALTQRARALTGSLLPSKLEPPPLIPYTATWADFVATHFARSVRQCQ